MHSSISNNNNTSTHDISATMSAIDKAIEDLRTQESINISATARKYGIIPCTLNRRWHGVTTTAEQTDDESQSVHQTDKLVCEMSAKCLRELRCATASRFVDVSLRNRVPQSAHKI
jgi:hypothetical protein